MTEVRSTPPEATVSPKDAADALKVSRETVHRWINAGKLAHVLEPNEHGRPIRRVPVSAIEAMKKLGILEELPRGAVPPLRTVTPPSPIDEAESRAIDRTLLKSTQALAHAAAESAARAESERWYRPRRRRQHDAEVRASIRLLDALSDVGGSSAADDVP